MISTVGRCVGCLALLAAVVGCASLSEAPSAGPDETLDSELVLLDWPDDMPESVLAAFTLETGVEVDYVTYETTDEAIEMIVSGREIDLVVLESDYIPAMVRAGHLAPIDYRFVPSFSNVSANFRDLAYDPGNRFSVPFNWGVTGLLVRTDLVPDPPRRWADLFEADAELLIGLRDNEREWLAVALKAGGHSINSTSTAEIEAASERLQTVADRTTMLGEYAAAAIPALAADEVNVLIAYAEDVLLARELGLDVTFVLPEEGTLLWGDSFVIPASTGRKRTAEAFLDFVLRPEVSAQIVNSNRYAMPIDGMARFVDQALLTEPAIFPDLGALEKAEVYLPLDVEQEALHHDAAERFRAARQ